MAAPGGNDPHSLAVTVLRASMNTLRPYLVDEVGLEPTMPEAEDLQSPGVTNFPTHP